MSEETYQRILQLQVEGDHSNRAEVIRNGLRAYAWLLKTVKDGYTIAKIKDGKITEIGPL